MSKATPLLTNMKLNIYDSSHRIRIHNMNLDSNIYASINTSPHFRVQLHHSTTLTQIIFLLTNWFIDSPKTHLMYFTFIKCFLIQLKIWTVLRSTSINDQNFKEVHFTRTLIYDYQWWFTTTWALIDSLLIRAHIHLYWVCDVCFKYYK